MQKFGAAQGRREDIRFLTGQGRYVDDIVPTGALHAVFLRSDRPHARIIGLDLSAARAAPGVHLVLAADDLRAAGVILAMKSARVTNHDGSRGAGPVRPVLADGTVRYVGEALAVVIADTPHAARDALELISWDAEDLPVSMGLAAGGHPMHDEAEGNLAYDYALGDAAAVQAALAASAHRVTLDVVHNRVIVNSIEPRAAYAQWDGARLHVCVNGQGVWPQRNELARMLALPREAVRVTNPDVGGGFGMKAMCYPEYIVIAAAARMLGQTVRWLSDRTEAMLTDNAGRDLIARTEIGFDDSHKITAYQVNLVSNLGAYNSQYAQEIQSALFSKVLTGVYDIQTAFLGAQGVYTNTTPVDAYRGAGRPEAILTIERVMDHAARALAVDPVVLRQKNFIRTFPYAMMNGEVIDGGDFDRVMRRAVTMADQAGFAARRAQSADKGLLRGLGLAVYIESILGDPDETARIAFAADGMVELYVGTQSNGQGHETVYPQLLAVQTGIPVDAIRVVQGDSDLIAHGGGTGGSRSVTVQGTAIRATATAMIDDFAAFLADELNLPGVVFQDGTFGAPGSNLRLTLIEAADMAREKGRDDLQSHSRTTVIDGRSFPNGAHLAEVEIDPETGAMRLDRYTVVDDFGTLINPTLVMGQVHGGVAQGYGQAVCEHGVYNREGQLLTASFMDYAMPRAADLPMIRFATEPVPTARNPLGMKGCGEAGTVGALGAVSNAVCDALAQAGVMGGVDMPFSPQRIWQWIAQACAPA